MKKNIWIMNHYATEMLVNKGGRHYWFAKELKKRGYNPTVFSCNVIHGAGGNYFDDDSLWSIHISDDDIPFVVISSTPYADNGLSRIKNMFIFAHNLVKSGKQYAKKHGKPDIILASSVHPLTVLAGEYLAKHLHVPCICEIRDLWPESIFAYFPEKRKKWYAKFLVAGEKLMYEKADAIVMTWAGGPQYIKDKGWDKCVPDNKVFHICNGVSLEEFAENVDNYHYEDDDLSNPDIFKVVYTGSIRHVNRIDMLVDAAQIIEERGNSKKVKILVWGAGDKVAEIQKEIEARHLSCIVLKGKVPKQYIPSILTQGDCCILHNASTELDRFGQSQNKFFEYLASGKPILMTYAVGYSICRKYNCGIELEKQTPEAIAFQIEELAKLSQKDQNNLKANVYNAALDYDFCKLTADLIKVIENIGQ